MSIERIKLVSATVAGGAVAAAVAVVIYAGGGPEHQNVAGGSGDSATGTSYVQPTASGMKLPSTTTEAPLITNEEAPTTLAIPLAAPTYKATAAPGCVNNGQCP
jgi:hypothetical protein